MRNAEKKLAAALAAIELYMQAESDAAERDAAPPPAIPGMVEPGQWAQSGRMEMMAARRMVQLRAFSNSR